MPEEKWVYATVILYFIRKSNTIDRTYSIPIGRLELRCNVYVSYPYVQAQFCSLLSGNVELLRCDEVWRHLVERYERLGCCIRDASLFPPPPAPSARQRHVQRNASDHWQKVLTCRQERKKIHRLSDVHSTNL